MGNIIDKLLARLYGKFPSLLERWARKGEILTFDDTWFVKPSKPIDECRVALITTGGVHLKSQEPFDMSDRNGDPSYREIPFDVSVEDLTVTHDYYDNRDALADPEVVFPLEALRELAEEGAIGGVNERHFSFMGHVMGYHVSTLMDVTAPEVAAELRKDGVGAVVLAPA